MKFSIPIALSCFRIVAGPVLLVQAWTMQRTGFVVLFVLALISDWLDGFVARRQKENSPLGARMDSLGDFSVLVALPFAAFRLYPDMLLREYPYLIMVLVCYAVPTGFGILKYGHFTAYHTWGAKFCTITFSLAFLVMMLGGSSRPFHLLLPLAVLECLQELAMTALLRQRHSDVPTLWHALRLRKQEFHAGRDGGQNRPAPNPI